MAAKKRTPTSLNNVVAPLPAHYRTNDFDLSNVTPDQVRSILRNVRTGKLDDQDRLFRLMVDSWYRLRKNLNEVAGAIARLNVEVVPAIREGETEPTPQAQAIAETVKRALESYAPKPEAWELSKSGAIKALVDAYAKGISVLEIIWHVQNGIISPRCYAPVPAKYLGYPTDSNAIDRLMLAPAGINNSTLEDFPPDRFLIGVWQQGGVHPIHCANLRALTKHWLAAIYGLGWLMQYAQLFSIPWRHIETDGTEDAMAKAEELLENIGSSGWAVTGPGMKLNIMDGVSGSAAAMPQSHLMDVADRACDILMLGQTLTTDVADSGSRALGDVHDGIRTDYIQAVASWVADIFTNQLIPSIVRLNYGAVASEDMPYCKIEVPDKKNGKQEAERIKIIKDSGIDMPKDYVYEALGVPMPEEGEPVIGEVQSFALNPFEVTTAARTEIDLRPTEEMAQAAQNALEVRRQKPPSERGMTAVGIARARDISNRAELSPDTIKRMASFFARHEVDKQGSTWGEKGKGWQAWNGWGGDAGQAWAKSKLKQLQNDEG